MSEISNILLSEEGMFPPGTPASPPNLPPSDASPPLFPALETVASIILEENSEFASALNVLGGLTPLNNPQGGPFTGKALLYEFYASTLFACAVVQSQCDVSKRRY